jgi:hypothetical protein
MNDQEPSDDLKKEITSPVMRYLSATIHLQDPNLSILMQRGGIYSSFIMDLSTEIWTGLRLC